MKCRLHAPFVSVLLRRTAVIIKLFGVLTVLRLILEQWNADIVQLPCARMQLLHDPLLGGPLEYTANMTWLKQRRRLLSAANRTLSKVLIVAYMRGGSTLVSHIFTADPSNAIYWFEPILPYYSKDTAVYTSRVVTGYQRQLIDELDANSDDVADVLEYLFTCRLDQLPIETFTHRFAAAELTRSTYDCIQNATGFLDGPLTTCLNYLINICGRLNDAAIIRRCSTIIVGLKSFKNDTNLTIGDLSTEMINALHYLDQSLRGFVEGVDGPASILNVFLMYRRCVLTLTNVASQNNCLEPLRQRCQHNTGRNIIAVKVIRARLHSIEETIRRIPDLSVIHLLRDPRAVAYSRYDSKIEPWEDGFRSFEPLRQSRVDVAKILCVRMLADLRVKRRLQMIYPNAILTVHYEDFVLNPLPTIARMFRHANHVVDNAMLQAWLKKHIFHDDNRTDGQTYEIIRKNPSSRTTRWMSAVNGTELEQINEHCRIVLDEMKYKL